MKNITKKGRSIGLILFGVLFILLAFKLVNLPLGYYWASAESAAIIYTTYEKRIQSIEEEWNETRDILIESGKETEFNQKLMEFKSDAENFKQNYVVEKKMLPHTPRFFSDSVLKSKG